MKRFIFISLTLLLSTLCIPAAAQVRNTRDYITIRMTPNHSDWNYRAGESAEISLSVERAGCVSPFSSIHASRYIELTGAN